MPFAISEGCRIYYRLEGDASKPLLVLVHSLGADHGMWDVQMPSLLRYFRIFRLDVRGHGASDSPPGDYTIAQLADDVLAVMAAAGAENFFYCGLSLGGMIGQRLAAKSPARIERLVLANTSSRMPDPALFDARRSTVLQNGMRAIEQAVLQRFFSPRTLAHANPNAESARATLLSTNPIGYAGCCAAIRDMDQRALLADIRVPTLVIGGYLDVSTPWSGHGDVLQAEIPNAQSVVLNAAHLSNIDRPSGFNSALLEFLLPQSQDTLEAGFAVRRSVLGDAHVDRAIASATEITRDFQELITRYAWGTVWQRPGLDPKVRRILTLAITASLGRWEEFQLHVSTGLAAELEECDLEEVLLQVAIYAGVPAANSGFQMLAKLRS